MRRGDRAGRQLLTALADQSPAFRRRPYQPAGGFGRRLLIALADAAPAFRPHPSADAARGDDIPRRGPGRGPDAMPQVREASTLQGELEELLSKIREIGPSPAHPRLRAETRRLTMVLAATADDDGYAIDIAIREADEHLAWLADTTIALEVRGEYFVATLGSSGTATFRRIPGGEWSPQLVAGRSPRGGFALPPLRRGMELAAAGQLGGSAVMRVVLPEAQGRLTLHRDPPDGYLLEVDRDADDLLVFQVRYGAEDRSERLLVIPARHAGLARLDGFSPTAPWQASVTTAGQLSAVDTSTVASSASAAANNATRRAWLEVADLVPGVSQVIGQDLDGAG